MHEVLGRVVDLVELEFESEHLCQPLLGVADRPRGLAARLGHAGIVWGDEFVEHGVVVGEEPVERVVILTAAQVHGPDQIDLERLRPPSGGSRLRGFHVGRDRRFEGDRLAG